MSEEPRPDQDAMFGELIRGVEKTEASRQMFSLLVDNLERGIQTGRWLGKMEAKMEAMGVKDSSRAIDDIVEGMVRKFRGSFK